ncbi:tail fiber assembly protein [Raoultella sp. DY2415]|uniref:tail fiber assembly protein n=1 Tax=Raoultella sp. DY2415 TaxID=2993656 RepID=UPI00225230C4|nr:tail fiber assembly protein [Raoultella sp. DY2415]
MLFSELNQSFYLPGIDYGDDFPIDAVEISEEEYRRFYLSINNGCRVYLKNKKFEISDKIPGKYHDWDAISLSWIIKEESRIKMVSDLINSRLQKKQSLMASASSAIAPLQDAVDIGIATDDEKTNLDKWKNYRVALNRLSVTSTNDVDWPAIPEF